MLIIQGSVMTVQSSLFWSTQKRRTKKDRKLNSSCSWIRPFEFTFCTQKSAEYWNSGGTSGWHWCLLGNEVYLPPEACLSAKDGRGEIEGVVCPESRREWGNIFCCCCILLINHFFFRTDVWRLQQGDHISQNLKCIPHPFPCRKYNNI